MLRGVVLERNLQSKNYVRSPCNSSIFGNFSSQIYVNSLSGDVLALEEHEAVSAETGHNVAEVDLPLAVGPRRPEGALARVVVHPDQLLGSVSSVKVKLKHYSNDSNILISQFQPKMTLTLDIKLHKTYFNEY